MRIISYESVRLIGMLLSEQGLSSKVLVEEGMVRTEKASMGDILKRTRIHQK